eukprot:15564564-Heterocapsa_arctica.AAC.1
MMWTWTDLVTACVHRITPIDLNALIFDPDWLRWHLPAHAAARISAVEKSWLCPSLCSTCRYWRLRCPSCRMKIRPWRLP